MDKSKIDYSVYLVTDCDHNHPSRTLLQTVEQALASSAVGIVQLREKRVGITNEEFVHFASQLHQLTSKYRIPLVINDRLDIALAVGAEGVHLGQNDPPGAREARRLLGPHKLLGVSVGSAEEARQALLDGADYLGIQTCFPTRIPKANPAPIQGHIGVREILESLPASSKYPVRTVTIGGLDKSNIRRLVCKSAGANGRCLDGVAVVSAIVAAEDAGPAAVRLKMEYELGRKDILDAGLHPHPSNLCNLKILNQIPDMLLALRAKCPLVHYITNYVSVNDVANATLAIGASPIMAPAQEEAKELARAAHALVLNIGTLAGEDELEAMLVAGRCMNSVGKPVILDPVGVGATTFRATATRRILTQLHIDVIKGNAAEIRAVAALVGCQVANAGGVESRGVDSVGGGLADPVCLVNAVAAREKTVVVMTGGIDYISAYGHWTFAVKNGDRMQGRVTGSGCMLAGIIGAFAGAGRHEAPDKDKNGHLAAAAVAGVVCFGLAGEAAAARSDVRGPGTFRATLMDELANLNPNDIAARMRVEIV